MGHHEDNYQPGGGGGGGGTNVWVRHSLLIAALSQSGSATGGSANKSRLPPNSTNSTSNANAVVTGLPTGNKYSKARDEDQASDFTSLTANSSMASGVNSTVGLSVGSVGGSTKQQQMWGWVKAKARTNADSDSSPDGVVVSITDADHPELDGRNIHIPSKLLQQQADGRKNNSVSSSSNSQIYGPDLVMANAWASFGSSSASVGSQSSRGGRSGPGQQQQLSGAAMEVPPADLIQVSLVTSSIGVIFYLFLYMFYIHMFVLPFA